MRSTGPSPETVTLVVERDSHCCVVCGYRINGSRGYDWSLQHRRARGMGGSRRADTNSPANLITVCGSGTTGDHGRIESRRSWAMTNGWLVPQFCTPANVPVLVGAQSRWVYLTDSGEYSDEPPAVAT